MTNRFKIQDSRFKIIKLLSLLFYMLFASSAFAMTDSEVAYYQKEISGKPIGEKIAFWAERFVGTPYDPDPIGTYVARKAIVADDKADCMYLSFRALELALSSSPEEAVNIALNKRFIGRGTIENGKVINYENRFRYGEDMIDSGKWGNEITRDIGPVKSIKGTRGRERVEIVEKKSLMERINGSLKYQSFESGDFVFFIKPDRKRYTGEIVGHIGIIKKEGDTLYLIHASGIKNSGGEVKKVLLSDYVSSMSFAGVRITRFSNLP